MNSKSPSVLKNISKFLIWKTKFCFGIKIIFLLTIRFFCVFVSRELFMYVSVNTVVCYY